MVNVSHWVERDLRGCSDFDQNPDPAAVLSVLPTHEDLGSILGIYTNIKDPVSHLAITQSSLYMAAEKSCEEIRYEDISHVFLDPGYWKEKSPVEKLYLDLRDGSVVELTISGVTGHGRDVFNFYHFLGHVSRASHLGL